MGVATATGMHVDVHQVGRSIRVAIDEAHVDAGLLDRLPARRLPRRLAGVNVPAGLHPDAEAAMDQQQDPAPSDDERRTGDVHGIGVLVERAVQPGNLRAEAGDAGALALVNRLVGGDRRQHVSQDGFLSHEWRR